MLLDYDTTGRANLLRYPTQLRLWATAAVTHTFDFLNALQTADIQMAGATTAADIVF